jgi:hypothetical protein
MSITVSPHNCIFYNESTDILIIRPIKMRGEMCRAKRRWNFQCCDPSEEINRLVLHGNTAGYLISIDLIKFAEK